MRGGTLRIRTQLPTSRFLREGKPDEMHPLGRGVTGGGAGCSSRLLSCEFGAELSRSSHSCSSSAFASCGVETPPLSTACADPGDMSSRAFAIRCTLRCEIGSVDRSAGAGVAPAAGEDAGAAPKPPKPLARAGSAPNPPKPGLVAGPDSAPKLPFVYGPSFSQRRNTPSFLLTRTNRSSAGCCSVRSLVLSHVEAFAS